MSVQKAEELLAKARNWELAAIIVNLVSFVALSIIYVSTLSTQRTVDYWTDYGGVVVQRLTLPIATTLLPFPLLTATAHAFAYFDFDGKFSRVIYDGVNRVRWIEYAITNGFITVSLLTLVGAGNIYLIVAGVLSNVVMNYFGYEHERANHPSQSTPTLRYLLAGFVPFFVIWTPTLAYQIARQSVSKTYETVAVYGSLVFALSFVLPLVLRYRRVLRDARYASKSNAYGANYRMQIFYTLLSMTAKIFLDWTVTIGNLVDP